LPVGCSLKHFLFLSLSAWERNGICLNFAWNSRQNLWMYRNGDHYNSAS
jgi:hypothetical protein